MVVGDLNQTHQIQTAGAGKLDVNTETKRYAAQQLSLLIEDECGNHLQITRSRRHHIHLLHLGKSLILRQFHLQKRDVGSHRAVGHTNRENPPEMRNQRIDHAAGVVLLRREERNRRSVSLSLIILHNTHILIRFELIDRLDIDDIVVFYEITLFSNPSRSSEKKRTLFILPKGCIRWEISTHRCLGCRCSDCAQGRELLVTALQI